MLVWCLASPARTLSALGLCTMGRTLTSQPRVLIADSDCEHHAILRALLGHYGYATVHVESVAAAYAILVQDPADLVILNVSLSGENELDLLYSLHLNPPPAIPVIVCTADSHAESRYPVVRRAAAGWFVKPIRYMDELLPLIDSLSRRGAADRK